jgi:hypothetical protein
MEKINFYFFCIYNFFYRDGFGLKDETSYKALPMEQRPVFALSLATWIWLSVIRIIIIKIFHPAHNIFFGKLDVLIPLACFGIYYFYFIENNRYINLYAEYRAISKSAQRNVIVYLAISLIVSVLLILLLGQSIIW